MTETNTPSPLIPNPLRALHESAGAEMQAYAELEIVSTFNEPQAEYAAIRKGAALFDLPQRGVIELRGRDRLLFLNNLLTNQTWNKTTKTGLGAGQGTYAFFLNTKGRILVDVNVLELADHTLLETDARLVPNLLTTFERYRFAEQVTLISKVGSLHEIAIHGPGATDLLNGVTEPPLQELGPLNAVSTQLLGAEVTIWRDDPCGVPGYHILTAIADAPSLWNKLLDRFGASPTLGKRALRPAGWAAYNAARIEAGRPLFDIDFGNSANPDLSLLPAETGQLTRAVSFTNGCYLGQEIVARMHARNQLARQIAGIRLPSDALPIAGAPVYDEGSNQIGIVTSSTISPLLSGVAICLAVLKKPFFNSGSVVQVPAEGTMHRAEVVPVPFV